MTAIALAVSTRNDRVPILVVTRVGDHWVMVMLVCGCPRSSLFEKLKDPEHEDDLKGREASRDVSAAVSYEEDFM